VHGTRDAHVAAAGASREGRNSWRFHVSYLLAVNRREWALSQGIHPQTAYRWYRRGKLPIPAQTMGKLILVGELDATTQASPGRAAVHARVSSADQRADLDRQVARVVAWAPSTATPSTRW